MFLTRQRPRTHPCEHGKHGHSIQSSARKRHGTQQSPQQHTSLPPSPTANAANLALCFLTMTVTKSRADCVGVRCNDWRLCTQASGRSAY